MEIVVVYSTFKDIQEAKKIGLYLLKRKLVVCANYFSTESAYSWKGKIENTKEVAGFFKTRKENWEKVQKVIKDQHSYDIPMIIRIDSDANQDYKDWLNKELK